MEQLFLRMLVTAAVGSLVLAVLLFPARGWLERRYAPQVRWVLWLGLAGMLVIGLFGQAPRPVLVVEAPRQMVALPAAAPATPTPGAGAANPGTPPPVGAGDSGPAAAVPSLPESSGYKTESSAPAARESIPLAEVLGWVWLTVAALLLAGQLGRYRLTRRRLMRGSAPCKEDFGETGRAALRVLPGLGSPVTLGYAAPVVFLPSGQVHPMAVRHELTHVRRRDIWGKTALFAVCALYWFDPLVWLMARVADRDMEAACDAQVVRDLSPAEKRGYGELLLSAAGQRSTPLGTHFGGGGREMKQRLTQLFRPGKTSRALVCLVVAAALGAASLVACESRRAEQIPADGTCYATFVMAKQGEASDFAKVGFELVDYAPGANWVGGCYETCTLPIAPAVRLKKAGEETQLSDGQQNWSQEVFNFLAWPNLRGQFIHGADVLRLEVAGGQVTAMEWVTGAQEKEGIFWSDADYGGEVPFVLNLPESWRDRFETSTGCTRDETGTLRSYRADFFRKDRSGAEGLLLTLLAEEEETYAGQSGGEGDPQSTIELGRFGGLVFSARWPRETAEGGQAGKQGEEYRTLLADLRAMLGSDSFAYTGGTEQPEGPQSPPQVSVDPAARAAFARELRDALETYGPAEGADGSRFAVADVDGDGAEELVLYLFPPVMAGHQGYILGYDSDSGQTREQLAGYPAFTCYSNGAVKEDWSHNQGWGEMWPYFLHVYDGETDRCRRVGMVSSWSRSLMEANGIPGYPEEADVSGSGVVYHINGETYDESHPVDERDYLAWLEPFLGDARELALPFTPLTESNIAALTGGAAPAAELLSIETINSMCPGSVADYYPGFVFDEIERDGVGYYRLQDADREVTLLVNGAQNRLEAQKGGGQALVTDIPSFLPSALGGEYTDVGLADLTGDGVEELIYIGVTGGTGAKMTACRVFDFAAGQVHTLSDWNDGGFTPRLLSRLSVETVRVEGDRAVCAVSLDGGAPRQGYIGVDSATTADRCDTSVTGGLGWFEVRRMGNRLWGTVSFTIRSGTPMGTYLGSVSAPLDYDSSAGAFRPTAEETTLTLYDPADQGAHFQQELAVTTDTGERLRLVVDCRQENEYWSGVSGFRVYAGEQLLQTVTVADAIRAAELAEWTTPSGTNWTQAPANAYLPEQMDLNFDGAPDIRLVELQGNVNFRWLCWLWNRESRRYEYAFFLVGHTMELRPEYGQIEVQARLNALEQETCQYRYDERGSLILVNRVVDRGGEPDGGDYWTETQDQGGEKVHYIYWNDYKAGQRFIQLTDIAPHTPLDQLPTDLLALLEPEAEPWTQESVGEWRQYTAPGLGLLTSKVNDQTLREWAQDEAEYEAERGREYVCSIWVTDEKYATGAGLRVGQSQEDWWALGYELGEGTNISQVGLESLNITVKDGRITQMQYSDGGRWVGNYFW